MLNLFEKVATKLQYNPKIGNSKKNRMSGNNIWFEFGDLRVQRHMHHVIIEIENAGGVTNLAKYWYCIKKGLVRPDRPVVLFHLFYKGSDNDYDSHKKLWEFLWEQIKSDVGNKIEASCYSYRNLKDLDLVLAEFKRKLEQLKTATVIRKAKI